MRLISILGALGIVAALVSGCAQGAEESGAGPAKADEAPNVAAAKLAALTDKKEV